MNPTTSLDLDPPSKTAPFIEIDPSSRIQIDALDRLLAACLFGVAGGGIWAVFAAVAGLFAHTDDFVWWVGGAALFASASVGAVGARGLVRRARSGSLYRVAGLGAWLMWASYAVGAVLFGLVMCIRDGAIEAYPLVVLMAFVVSTVLLSPGLILGMATAAIYGAIVRGASWTETLPAAYLNRP